MNIYLYLYVCVCFNHRSVSLSFSEAFSVYLVDNVANKVEIP